MTRLPEPRKHFLRIGRRPALAGLGVALWSGIAGAQVAFDPDEDLWNLQLLDVKEGGRRAVVLLPRYLQPAQRIPLAVFLHGLGETGDERAGAYAWVERYGLSKAWQRLKRAPLERTSTRGEWTDGRLSEVNADLVARPFRGMAMVCPFMPKPRSPADLDAYARWIESALLPRVRRDNPAIEDAPERTALCGVSLGGYVALEVLTRLPKVFGAWAGVQTAIGTFAAPAYADRIARGTDRPRPMLLLTSSQDQWRSSSEALRDALASKRQDVTYRVVPGPHDQPWLREAGTIETLAWLDRALTR
ncbi:MAG: putative esterase [Labilithrix sp.]|nr:putative esterase [Labilithrix sp.]